MPFANLFAIVFSLAPLQTASADATGPLPASINIGGIERCNPGTIDRAIECLTSNLDQDDQGDLAREGGAKFRPATYALMTRAWHLDDPAAPVSQDMAKRGIYYPGNAASVLASIMDSRVQGIRVDYKRLSNDLKKTAPVAVAPPPSPVATAPTRTTIAPGATPSMAGAVAVPVEQCKRPDALPGEIVVSCMKLPNGGLVAQRRVPNPPKAPN